MPTPSPEDATMAVLRILTSRAKLGSYEASTRSMHLAQSLQTAYLARRSNSPIADDDVILASLLRDIGLFLPQCQASVYSSNSNPIVTHEYEALGARYLSSLGFSEKVCSLIEGRGMGERYICAVQKGYFDGLSNGRKAKMEQLGGAMGEEEMREFENSEFKDEFSAMLLWDRGVSAPADIEAQIPGLEDYKDMMMRHLERRNSASSVASDDTSASAAAVTTAAVAATAAATTTNTTPAVTSAANGIGGGRLQDQMKAVLA